jgi:hypothetical protein
MDCRAVIGSRSHPSTLPSNVVLPEDLTTELAREASLLRSKRDPSGTEGTARDPDRARICIAAR